MFESNRDGVIQVDVHLSFEQEHAIELCCDLTERIVGITGSAGTGKTLVLGKVHDELSSSHLVALAAPTGRAAKRITELSGIGATTIHRLLRFPMPDDPIEPGEKPIPGVPRHNKANPLDAKVIIIDEASMLSTELYACVLDAMRPDAVLRLFGDNEQLAPVEDNSGAPPPFIDVLKTYPMVRLTHNFRSQDDIIGNSQLILRGRLPQRMPRFTIIYTDHPIEQLIEFVTPEFANLDHQVIMPMRRGKHGTTRVNPSIQMRFNPNGPMLRLQRFGDKEAPLSVRAKDKYLWIKNDYNLALFNGELGPIDWVNPEDGVLGVLAGKRAITIPPRLKYFDYLRGHIISYDPRRQIELGYAITTHKSQGSEFNSVVYCMSRAMYFLLNRRNLYTAVTRARHRVVIITDRYAMGMSLRKRD